MKKGDIYRWSYNQSYIEKNQIKIDAGTLYWCSSRIGVIDTDKSNLWLVDTYWGSGSHCKIFNDERIDEILDIVFVANFEDLEKAIPISRAYYLDDDCVDLNHPNSSSGNFYLRKGAKKSIEKMTKVIARKKHDLEISIKSELRTIKSLEKDLLDVNEDTLIYAVDDISLEDHSYVDDEIIKELK